jgi:hypothetical protein
MEKAEWNSVIANIPVIAPYTEIVSIKKAVHQRTVKSLKTSSGRWPDKAELLKNRFIEFAGSAQTTAELATQDLGDYYTNVYEFQDVGLLDSQLRPLNLGANGLHFPVATRNACRWISFTLITRPRNINTGHLEIEATLFPPPSTVSVYIRAVKLANMLHPEVTRDTLLTDPKSLIEIYDTADEAFDILQIRRTGQPPEHETHALWLENLKAKIEFEAIAQITEKGYVGRAEGIESLAQRILKVKQHQFDPTTNTNKYLSVQELSQSFQNQLAECNGRDASAGLGLPNLATTAYQAMTTQLKDKLVDYIPDVEPVDFQENMAMFDAFMTEAKRAEKELRTIINIARSAASARSPNTYNRGPRGPRTFLAHPYTGDHDTEDFDDDEAHAGPRQATGNTTVTFEGTDTMLLPSFCCFIAKKPGRSDEDKVKDLILHKTLTLLSMAEQALQDASGTKAPIKCFGCGEFHQFKDCPKKGDPGIYETFRKNLQEWRDSRRNTYRANRQAGRWKQEGYPTRSTADVVKQIADPLTSQNVRKTLLCALQEQLSHVDINSDDDEDEPDAKPAAKPLKKARKRKTGGYAFISYQVKTNPQKLRNPLSPAARGHSFLAEPKRQYEFAISEKLPFLNLPIGRDVTPDGTDKGFLAGLYDTGGCCNMGWSEYYHALKDKYPQFIAEHVHLEDSKYENIHIGGLNGGIEITEMMKLWLPFTDNGAHATLTLGLSADLPVNTLFGLPFQIQAKMKLDIHKQRIYSEVFQEEFKVQLRRPERIPIDSLNYKDASNRTFLTDSNTATTGLE